MIRNLGRGDRHRRITIHAKRKPRRNVLIGSVLLYDELTRAQLNKLTNHFLSHGTSDHATALKKAIVAVAPALGKLPNIIASSDSFYILGAVRSSRKLRLRLYRSLESQATTRLTRRIARTMAPPGRPRHQTSRQIPASRTDPLNTIVSERQKNRKARAIGRTESPPWAVARSFPRHYPRRFPRVLTRSTISSSDVVDVNDEGSATRRLRPE